MDVARISRERARKLVQIPHEDAVSVSLSQVFFLLGLTLLLILGYLEAVGVDYGKGTKSIYAAAAVLSFVVSYLLFERVASVDFFDFVSAMIFTGEVRRLPHGRILDASAAQMYLGLVVISIAPIVYSKYASVSAAAGLLVLGGLLVASAVVGYVLSGRARR